MNQKTTSEYQEVISMEEYLDKRKRQKKKWKRSLRWSGTKDTIPALRNYCSVMRRWFRLWILRNKPEETAWVLHCSIVL